MKGSLNYTGSILSGTHTCFKNWYVAKGEIRQHFQGCLRPSCFRWLCFLHKSTEFHDVRTECQRKIILINFLLYSLFQSLPDHLRPNFLAHRSLAPQSIVPQLLAPQRSLPYSSFPLIILSPIASLIPSAWSIVFYCPIGSPIAWLIFLLSSKHSLHFPIDRPLINPQSSFSSAVDFQLICITDSRYIASTDPVPGLLLLSLIFCHQIFLWFSKKVLALTIHNW